MGNNYISILLFSIFLVSILGCLGIIVWLYQLNSQKRLKSRMYEFVDEKGEKSAQVLASPEFQISSLDGIRGRINTAFSSFSSDSLRLKIASAYWPISDVEFIFIRILVSLAGLFLGWIIAGNIIGGLGLGLVVYLIPAMVLDRSIIRRRKKFQDQLLDFLILVKGAISVGSSLQQAIDMAVKETPAPINEEFNQVLREIQLGYPLDVAFQNLATRMQGDDLQIVVTAIIINNQLGGNLSTLLEATIETIRDRMQLFSKVRSLTSYTRFVSYIISLLPLFLAVIIYLMSPEYFDTAKTSIVTQIVLLMGLFGIILGNIVMRLVMRIKI